MYNLQIVTRNLQKLVIRLIYKTKVERKHIDLIDEEEAQIGGDRSSATSNKAEIYNEEARKKTQKHLTMRFSWNISLLLFEVKHTYI